MASAKCPECGERVKAREGAARIRCPECGKWFRPDEGDDVLHLRAKRKSDGMSGARITALVVGSILALATVALVVVLLTRKDARERRAGDADPVDAAKVTRDHFKSVMPGMGPASEFGM